MKYDFTSVIDRRGMDALAVECGVKHWGAEPDAPDEGYDFIPMWVADMNFATCPAVTDAIIERVKHPLFGYYRPRPEYFDSIIRWQTERHGYKDLKREYIAYENGVHGCIVSCVNVLSRPGDPIFVHRPTYIGFNADIQGQGRVPVYSDLVKDENGVYRMDYEDMDRKLRENHVHLAIFCSPHNPAGRVWERWELEKAMEVFERNECFVISDEIWSDICYQGHPHTPTVMVNGWSREHAVSIYALSKTFNLAAMCGSYHVIYSDYLRDRISAYSARTAYNEQNVLTMHALLGAYSPAGYEWVDELNTVLEENARIMHEAITSIDGVEATMPEGTYMMFVDLTGYCERTGRTHDEVLKAGWKYGVGWQDGNAFGGTCHLRLNLASPTARIKEACDRIKELVLVD